MFKKTAMLALFSLIALSGCNKGSKDNSTTDTTQGGKAVVSANDSKIVPVGTSYGKGGTDPIVTIIEFSDFQCPFCSRVNPTIKKIRETFKDDVKIVFKHNPLSFHKKAPYAAQAAQAAGAQGKFWEMHDILFANQKKIDPADIKKYAGELGLDIAKFEKAVSSKSIKDEVAADMALAVKVGARGTPNFMINGKQLSGAQPFPRFETVIKAEIEAAKALIKAGSKRSDVYAKRVAINFKKPAARAANKKGGDASKVVYKLPLAASTAKKGGDEPLVTIVEFSDFQCPFCSRVNPTIKKITDTYGDKVQVRFRHNPLSFHKDAPLAAEAASAANAQGKFWEMHDTIFANQKKIKRADLEGYAQKIGLDMTKFKADLDNGTFKKQIAADQAIARTFGARGTPNFFVNGRQLSGAQPFPSFKKIIDEEIKKAEALIAKGTAKKDVYTALTAKGATKAQPKAAKKNRKAPANDKTVYKVAVNAGDAVKGPSDALVTIIEFSEFQCPFCSRVLPTMKQIEKAYGKDVRVVFKHSPLPFHKDAPLASQAALAAGLQGKFWPMHDKMFANQRKLKQPELEKYATEIGLNMDKFKTDLNSDTLKAQIKADQKLAASIGARGTPNFFINGRKLTGAQPFANFKKIIDQELIKAKALEKKGTPRNKIYAELTKNGATKAAAPAARGPKPDDNKVYDVKIGANDGIKGNKNAAVTIVEFSDFQCPFCSRVNPTIAKVMETYKGKVRVVFKHNPLPFHKDAPLASEAALAAGAQGKFWQMHDLMFKNQRQLKRPELEKYAAEIGLNVEKFKAALDAGTYKAQVAADTAQARSLGASGTPTFFINGKKLRGAQPFPAFKAKIDAALAGKK